ncbi:hypothetical protein GYMLUDRAFT_468861 [Collybiopsis luxurians FD-317 M1]|uniref:Unplaced genomic scaffold GYMLUscaffold_16, whole genome shotgun sequence n=1 Tax=Collybiopsis luxurians FD-317 M1 TaxID=944289 RepID=A0A0D0BHS9_9AGAR|nr:hypothetical protein GYMLUDRAFT_468861 [Collybiopsis luxurians FD-317 M1]
MLPERAGYVVVDGIVDPVSWSNEPTHQWSTHWLADAEKTYEKFLSDCSKAGPPLCPLALHEGEPWRNIESRFEEFFDRLAREPMRVNSIGGRQGRPSSNDEGERRQGVLTSGAARGLLESFLYNPQRWPEAAQLYSSAFKGDAEGLYNHIRPPPFNSSSRTTSIPSHSHSLPTRRDLHRQAITCLDSPPSSTPPSAEELARIGLYNLRNVSPHFGVSLAMNVLEPDIGCEFWPVHIGAREEREANRGEGKENTINERQSLPERFSGPWGLGKGKTPGPGSDTELERRMVIISNTADPITPLSGGLHLNALMPDSSVIVIQDGPGHCSNGLPSVCTAKLVRGYFSGTGTGTSTNPNADKDGIPFNGTICTPDMLTFPDPRRSIDGIESVMWSLMSEEDRTLLRAVRDIRRGYEDG